MKKNGVSKASQGRKTAPMRKQGLPRGWDARKVRAVIAHYERLTDEELAREIEEAPEVTGETLIAVPTELLPAVKKLIARHQKSA